MQRAAPSLRQEARQAERAAWSWSPVICRSRSAPPGFCDSVLLGARDPVYLQLHRRRKWLHQQKSRENAAAFL